MNNEQTHPKAIYWATKESVKTIHEILKNTPCLGAAILLPFGLIGVAVTALIETPFIPLEVYAKYFLTPKK